MDLLGYAISEETKVYRDGSNQEYIEVAPYLRATKVVDYDGEEAIRLSIVSEGKVFRGPHVRKEDLLKTFSAMLHLLNV